MKCSMDVTPSQKGHCHSVTSHLVFSLRYSNNLSLTQKLKIPSSLDAIPEWQTRMDFLPLLLEFLMKQKST